MPCNNFGFTSYIVSEFWGLGAVRVRCRAIIFVLHLTSFLSSGG